MCVCVCVCLSVCLSVFMTILKYIHTNIGIDTDPPHTHIYIYIYIYIYIFSIKIISWDWIALPKPSVPFFSLIGCLSNSKEPNLHQYFHSRGGKTQSYAFPNSNSLKFWSKQPLSWLEHFWSSTFLKTINVTLHISTNFKHSKIWSLGIKLDIFEEFILKSQQMENS